MDKLEKLTVQFIKKHPNSILKNLDYMDDKHIKNLTAHDSFMQKLQIYSRWAIDHDLIHHRNDLKAMDLIDLSGIFPDTPNLADLPGIPNLAGYKEELNKCWYLIIPPFKEGTMKINRHRYVKWCIQEINEEEQSYWVSLEDYAYDGVWLQDNLLVGQFCWNPKVDEGKSGYHRTAGDPLSLLIEKDLKEDVPGLDEDTRSYLTDVAIPYLRSVEDDEDLDDVFLHFVGAIIYTNIKLLHSKPKAIRGSGNKIKTSAGDVDKSPKPKIVRTIDGGIRITSVKPPRPASPDTIRTYHIAAWKSRGHIRHYKNGKTVYVRESIHHRKCLQEETPVIPQTIIKVG